MDGFVNIKINGEKIQVPGNYTVLQAARKANIDIPTLCFLKDINEIGACRMCLIEVKGARTLQASCVYPVSEGLEVLTNTPKIREARRVVLDLILSNHDRSCLTCVRNQSCELQKLAEEFHIDKIKFEGEHSNYQIDDSSPSMVRDPNKCILCRRCVSMCNKVQQVCAIGTYYRGFKSKVSTPFEKKISEVACALCGQCINVCPTGALREKDDTYKVWKAIEDPEKFVIAQTAPAVRVALGEEFGLKMGTKVTGKMVSALKKLGFDKVFDTNAAADLTIMEEGTELIERIKNGGKLPLITSCSPGWVKYIEHFYPELLGNLSTCKSPHQMFGAILKSYYAEKLNIDPSKIYVVSIMPCVAKKFEAQRPEMEVDGLRDIDAVITTRELARMIKEAGINFTNLKDKNFDNPIGEGSGAGAIFGATGGVMEAALRTVSEILSGKESPLEYEQVRGIQGIKEASIQIGDLTLKAAVAHGLGNARKLLDRIESGEAKYDFVEIMACPGGCINGGGQPIVSSKDRMEKDIRVERAKTIYKVDKKLPIRKSHENPFIQKLYSEYLGEPGSHESHKLLHTHYTERVKY